MGLGLERPRLRNASALGKRHPAMDQPHRQQRQRDHHYFKGHASTLNTTGGHGTDRTQSRAPYRCNKGVTRMTRVHHGERT
jgi:hypothetical protein